MATGRLAVASAKGHAVAPKPKAPAPPGAAAPRSPSRPVSKQKSKPQAKANPHAVKFDAGHEIGDIDRRLDALQSFLKQQITE